MIFWCLRRAFKILGEVQIFNYSSKGSKNLKFVAALFIHCGRMHRLLDGSNLYQSTWREREGGRVTLLRKVFDAVNVKFSFVLSKQYNK